MKLCVYSIFDVKAGVFNTPFFQVNDQVAKRAFSDLVNDPQSMLFKHPEDFTLWRLGEFDDQLGDFEETKDHAREVVCNALIMKVQDENQETVR